MSKYDALWNRIKENGTDSFALSFGEIEKLQDCRYTILS